MAADDFEFSMRVFDPKEKTDADKSVQFVKVAVKRGDAKLKPDDFIEKYVKPNLAKLVKVLPLDAT